MPSYDYRCVSCGNVFEVVKAMKDTSDECCPDCDASAKRVFTPVGVAFKGSGFHNTDYKPRPTDDAAPSCPSKSEGGGCAGCPAAD